MCIRVASRSRIYEWVRGCAVKARAGADGSENQLVFRKVDPHHEKGRLLLRPPPGTPRHLLSSSTRCHEAVLDVQSRQKVMANTLRLFLVSGTETAPITFTRLVFCHISYSFIGLDSKGFGNYFLCEMSS
jgi:hypothetical protein